MISNGASVSGAGGGGVGFQVAASAESATLIANGGTNGGDGASVVFTGVSTGGTSRIEVFGNGNLDISPLSNPGVSVGSIQGNGNVFLGGDNLTVGFNNLSTVFSAGTLTISNALTFNSLSTNKCVLNRSSSQASQVLALGVTINSNASFTFVDTGSGTLPTGTVFTVVNNISGSPIAGRFSNLADGLIFTSKGANFKVSYKGGTGNDLVLKVVP